MKTTKLWLRIIGSFYLVVFVLAGLLKISIRTIAPAGTLDRAAAGDVLAKLLADSWLTIGIDYAALGIALLLASRKPESSASLILGILVFELIRGIGIASYMIIQGYEPSPQIFFVILHTVVIVTGVVVLRNFRDQEKTRAAI
jgi:hypothetical protein